MKKPENVNIGYYVAIYQKWHGFCEKDMSVVDKSQVEWKNDGFNDVLKKGLEFYNYKKLKKAAEQGLTDAKYMLDWCSWKYNWQDTVEKI